MPPFDCLQTMPRPSRPLCVVVGVVLTSRAALYALGMRFYDDEVDRYMPFLDVAWLREDLLSSVWHLHLKPPVMNLGVGTVLQGAGDHASVVFALVFTALGGVGAVSLFDLMRQAGLAPWSATGVAAAFALSPPVLLFETFLLHTYPAAILVTATLACFGRALAPDADARWWTATMALGGLLCLTRSLFHLVWLVGLVVLALVLRPDQRRSILARAALPSAAVVLWYAKNLALVGVFGASSWLGLSLAKGTVGRLPAATVDAWIDAGRLSPVAQVDPFAAPEAYTPYVNVPPPTGIPALDATRKSSGAVNYNHRVYPVVGHAQRRNALATIRHAPGRYLRTVGRDVVHFLRPATTWHPREPCGSPFQTNRRLLGDVEDVYNAVVHAPIAGAPVGLFALVPLVLAGGLVQGLRHVRAGRTTRGGRLLAVTGTALYVTAVCCLVETGVELSRMRFVIDAVLLTAAIALGVDGRRAWRTRDAGRVVSYEL